MNIDRKDKLNSSHSLSREYIGQGEGQEITPKCSCGWKGRTVYQYQDTPIMDLIEQEKEHIYHMEQL